MRWPRKVADEIRCSGLWVDDPKALPPVVDDICVRVVVDVVVRLVHCHTDQVSAIAAVLVADGMRLAGRY